jgi:hypothetical protein
MVTLDYGDRAAGFEQCAKRCQRLGGPGKMLEDEANENVIEGCLGEGEREDVDLPELDVRKSRGFGPSRRFRERVCCDIHRRKPGSRAPLGKRDRLGADAASSLQHRASRRVPGVGVQQFDQRSRLIPQTLILP